MLISERAASIGRSGRRFLQMIIWCGEGEERSAEESKIRAAVMDVEGKTWPPALRDGDDDDFFGLWLVKKNGDNF